jgi:hypothetical protein
VTPIPDVDVLYWGPVVCERVNVNAFSTSDGTFFQFSKPGLPPDPFKVVTTIQKQLYYGVISTQMSNIPNIRFKHGLFYLNSSEKID